VRGCQFVYGGIHCGKPATMTMVFRVPGHAHGTVERATCAEHAHPSTPWGRDLDPLDREVRR
jgi:hypothetical protein